MDFTFERSQGLHHIVCPKLLEPGCGKALETLVESWLLLPENIHVLDFKKCKSLSPAAYRPFVLFYHQLKQNDKHLFAVNLSGEIARSVQLSGLTSVFNLVGSIEEARVKAQASAQAATKPSLDMALINPFIVAAQNVIETQARTKLKALKPCLKKAGEAHPVEIAGVISVECGSFRGAVVLCFTDKVFLGLYKNMVGETHTKITDDLMDAAGELLNIIYGQVKTTLNDQNGYDLVKAIPTVLRGEKLRVQHQSQYPTIMIPFETEFGLFRIEIAIESTK